MSSPTVIPPNLLTNNPRIDADHLGFYERFERTKEFLQSGQASPEELHSFLLNTFSDLKRYAENHFGYEEKMMEVIGYNITWANQHKMAHKTFFALIDKRLEVLKQEQFNNQFDVLNLVILMTNWWNNHITTFDIQFAGAIHEFYDHKS